MAFQLSFSSKGVIKRTIPRLLMALDGPVLPVANGCLLTACVYLLIFAISVQGQED